MDSQFDQRNESGDSLHIDKIGGIDLFLLDQVLKGNIHREMNILEVGCGYGKNLPFFLESKYHISGIDKDPKAIHSIQSHLKTQYPKVELSRFQVQDILTYTDESSSYDAILCLAVLHTLEPNEYETALVNIWKMLSKGGILIIRTYVKGVGEEFSLKGDSDGYTLVPHTELLEMLEKLGGKQYEPANVLLSKKNKPILSAYLFKV